MPSHKSSMNEYSTIIGAISIIVIVIFLVLVRNDLPNYGDWSLITTYLIASLPYIFLLFIGFAVIVKLKGVFIVIGSGVIGISFALLIGQLNDEGLIDVTKSIGQLFGGINAVMAIIIMLSLVFGSILYAYKR